MITFLQQALYKKHTFATETDPTRATHFQRDGGQIQPIAELNTNNIPVENINTDDVKPLEIPIMNFGNEESTNQNDGPLVAPSLF